LALVKQTLSVYLREVTANQESVKWLCICSDEGIGKSEDVLYRTENLGIPTVTDKNYIQDWLRKNQNEKLMVFTTYQSGRIIADASKEIDFKFDVGIYDEAHKTVGSSKRLFSHLLFDDHIKVDKKVFMTATQRFYSGNKDDILSMDDESIYGKEFAVMSFKEAIQSEPQLLTDYKIITLEVTKSEIAEFIRENQLVQLDDRWGRETETRSLASMIALRKAMSRFPIQNAVSFHGSIAKAKSCKELQPYLTEKYQFNPIDAFTVSGKLPTSKRTKLINEFAESDGALITNAKCLTEGVDVPKIDCIVFSDPRRSRIDIVQALGRALRTREDKKYGYVVLPIVYDDQSDEIDNENFKEIVDVVRGLAANDERIIEYFKNRSTNKTSKHNLDENLFTVLGQYISEEDIHGKIEIKIWEKLTQYEWLPFEEAREYVRKMNFNGTKDWRGFRKSGKKPHNIPSHPDMVYSLQGWKDWGDWFGASNIPSSKIEYLPFSEARDFARALKLNSRSEWNRYWKKNRPNGIPRNPERTYKLNGWKGVGDWLGTGRVRTQDIKYKNFEEAREFVRNLKLQSRSEWRKYWKEQKPEGIPSQPDKTYKTKGWKSMGDWLGTGGVAPQNTPKRPFELARKFVRNKSIRSETEWRKWCKTGERPQDIPTNPQRSYKEDWVSWQDWLGNDYQTSFLNFHQARKVARSLKCKSREDWRKLCRENRKPIGIPSSPDSVYKDKGWKGYKDWLGY
jgi:superfamily II DNA or RNA helicase